MPDINAAQITLSGLNVTPSTKDLTVEVSSGNLIAQAYGSVLAVPAQTFTATSPEGGDRIDLLVIDPTTGAETIVEGEPGSKFAPNTPPDQISFATFTVPDGAKDLSESTVRWIGPRSN